MGYVVCRCKRDPIGAKAMPADGVERPRHHQPRFDRFQIPGSALFASSPSAHARPNL